MSATVKINGREVLKSDPSSPLALPSSISRSIITQPLSARGQAKISTQLQLIAGQVPQPNIARRNLNEL